MNDLSNFMQQTLSASITFAFLTGSSLLAQQPSQEKLVRHYQPSKDKVSYCAPVISNGTLYTQIDLSGAQRQNIRYTNHGKRASRLDLTPGVYLAGRRYDTLLRDLIPFGYFEDSCSAAGKEFGNAKDSGQILDLGNGSTGCRNTFENGSTIDTHAFVHHDYPMLAVRKKFSGMPAGSTYRFDYYYASAGTERKPVRWSNFTID